MKPLGLNIINNEAFLHNYRISDLAKKYQTPLYIMDEEHIKHSINEYQMFFKSDYFHTSVIYASKAFLTASFAKYIDTFGLYIDAVSLGDLYVIHRSGVRMEKVVFHGNNKSLEELRYAIENNVGIIVVDNLFELKHLARLANEYQKEISILIRVNPGIDAHTHQYIQTAKFTSKFGESIYDEEIIKQLIMCCISSTYLKLMGFHAHIGSQIHEIEAFRLEITKMIDFQNMINDKFQLSLDTLNLGGGFGIQYTYGEKNIPIKEVMMSLIGNIEKKLNSSNSKINNFMIEPGRSIVGEAGITVYECSQIKSTYGKKNYLFIDGGMSDNIRPALYGAVYECDIANKMTNRKEILVDVVGKCCESGDIIRKDVMIPQINEGDLLIVYATGAYNYSMASHYNNLLKPAVIMVGKKEVKLMSRREKLKDLCNLF